ncbi:prepilin-type N-terminal cleavage/methylation domain-containing protein [uncultured Desulfuromusa sp.]|uniref:type IV pilin protein n=1 Tax=uncultured Desulfuromusa sp. TaxID=219183 RepID=UPI002AA8C977|nr:prepilin-type N-terminal cleavage/methylation domain-containing protein [uncultured Desulfuromusa sp.]
MINLLKCAKSSKGFTLFELLAVMVIMSILASIAVPSYKRSQIKARESALAEDLYQMRRSIDAFFADNGLYPDSLDQLVSSKYIRDVPRDPFTLRSDSWNCLPPEPAENGQLAEGGCFDIRSGSDLIGLNDIPYQEW